MRYLRLREGDPATVLDAPLDTEELRALEAAELVVITRTPTSEWAVAAGRKVGVVRVGDDLQVVVEPKIPVRRLMFLLAHVNDPSFWRDPTVELPQEAGMASVLAETFRRLSVYSIGNGLLHGYQTVDETSPVLRGRIRLADQVGRRHGVMMPLEITRDDYTADIAENQVLLAATVKLLRLPGLSALTRQHLHQLRHAFADVTVIDGDRRRRPRWQMSRLNQRYWPPLRLAEIILDGDSVEQSAQTGSTTITGFVVDMWRVFEDFVCTVLGRELAQQGGRVVSQHRGHLDDARTVALRPDLVWERGGRVQLVADAKYKALNDGDFKHADLYQLLAYCTVLDRRHGHLIYAAGGATPRVVKVAGSDVRIHCHTLDLDAEPAELHHQVQSLAQRITTPQLG